MTFSSSLINISTYQLITVFLVGLAFGSFINVCIWRIPRKKLITYPFSHCPKCGTFLRWYDNIPLLSYLLLKGHCRYCGEKISFHYPLIELLTGLTFLLFYLKFSLTTQLLFALGLSVFLLIASGIDYYHRIIPDKLTYPLMIIGLSFSFFNPFLPTYQLTNLSTYQLYINRFLYVLCSLLLAGSLLYLIGLLGEKIFKKEAMGGGDIKLFAGIGAFVGIKNIFWIIFLASLIGGIIGLLQMLYYKFRQIDVDDDTIPFGPYLSLATFLVLLLKV